MKDVKDTDYLQWSREDFLFHHRKMWNWIADQTLKLKRNVAKFEYFEAMGIPKCERPFALCYCCQYTNIIQDDGLIRCKYCPINWKSNAKHTMCLSLSESRQSGGLFGRWRWVFTDDNYYKYAARLARTIANLPEVENV